MGPSSPADVLGQLTPQLILFVYVFSRLGGLVLTCSQLAPEALKARFKAAMCLWVAVAVSLALARLAPPPAPPMVMAAGIVTEVLVGAGMGLVVRLGAAALSLAGELVEMVVGFGFSQMVDPMSHDQAGPLRLLAQSMGAMTFLAMGGQQLVLEAWARSFQLWPPGQAPWPARLGLGLCGQFSGILVVALRMAAPLLAAALSTLLALAFLTRVAPQLNIWSVGFLVTTSVSLAGLLWYLPAWLEMVALLWRQQVGAMLPTLAG